MQLGASFSHPHLKWLGLDPEKALEEFKGLGLEWIRLGCYWNEIEKEKGIYYFSELDKLVSFCEKNNLKIILTVGMKAPRWPEFYIPDWLSEKTNLRKFTKISSKNYSLAEAVTNFIEKCVNHYKNSSAIKVWQVENEPLDPSGPKWLRIDHQFLQTEIELIKKLDPKRKILINLWGNELGKRRLYQKAYKLGDIIGLGLYLKHPLMIAGKFIKYIGPLDSQENLQKIASEITQNSKKLWITELQAEPWEPSNELRNSTNPPSFSPKDLEKNFNYVLELKPELVLFWGFEYWYYRKINGDLRYWQEVKKTAHDLQ